HRRPRAYDQLQGDSHHSSLFRESQMLERGNLSRRGFLARSTAALLGTGLPLWFAREEVARGEEYAAASARKLQANDRLRLGFIGVGDRAGQLIGELKTRHNNQVSFIAICDADQGHLTQRSTQIGGNPTQFRNFRDLLARNDIDAVFVVTPDHW